MTDAYRRGLVYGLGAGRVNGASVAARGFSRCFGGQSRFRLGQEFGVRCTDDNRVDVDTHVRHLWGAQVVGAEAV